MHKLKVSVSFSYGKKEIVKNVEFEGKVGEIIAIIGPNGAGKSTLLKCIAGILKPRGIIEYNGIDLTKLKPKERAKIVGYVPQSSYPEFAFTVEEFVELGTYAGKGDVDEAIRRVGLWEKRKEFITNLSGGEYQLTLIARALAQGGDIMLLDEPTSHLDINHTREIMEILQELKKEKLIIAVFHDLNLAINYADEIIVLKNGETAWKGKSKEISEEVIEATYGIKPRIVREDGIVAVLP
ncbi:ABC transporter ATP-binding protein [Pyrococcus furiosus DSM 3638]|uniref:ABC transporter ATP-binding protein n=3 Tax=Pyrococcus furiosus TaxID=2261 RepID=A0A5C0XP71_PYRFU|nr:ABC transporter ATP-binding protein [Pyrococcus furiosus]AAL80626.1 iron(III) dicitrate transport system permease protein fece [Pyrococcus furiosus DSM 3638]AFN03297.1 iron(III) dicitrate transport system permease fece [Pyrococcus furiosus COM1]QEK78215.1 ABC transporter ATP-binding protein [Pyrococcus furiosus DSM 3638]